MNKTTIPPFSQQPVTKPKKITTFSKRNKNIKVVFWNKGNSDFQSKKDEIELIIDKHNPLVMGVLEANISQNVHLPSVQIDGYILEREVPPDDSSRTRTALFIKNDVKYIRRYDLEQPQTSMIWLEIYTSAKPWLLFIGYRQFATLNPRTAKASRDIKKQLERIKKWEVSWTQAEQEGKPLLILGDMNIDVSPSLYSIC